MPLRQFDGLLATSVGHRIISHDDGIASPSRGFYCRDYVFRLSGVDDLCFDF